MRKFRIKPEVATNISNNISHIGGQTVFENPELLTKKLASWSTEISPAKRKLIIEQWFAERGIEVPEEVSEKAGKGPDELRKEARGKVEAENIYYVEPDTAIIRLAAGNERATTLSEAKELQKLIRKDLEEARKRQEAEGSVKEPAFVMGEQGAWTLNPKGKIGFGEFAVFQMYQDSLRRGEPIDPVEELTRREEQSLRLKEAMGVKAGGGDTEMTMLDKLDKLGILKKSEGGEGALLSQLSALGLLKKTGEEGSATQIEMLDKLNQLGLLKKTGEEGSATQIEILDKLNQLGLLKKTGEEGSATQIEILDKLNQLGLLKKTGEEGSATQIEMLDKLNQLGLLKKPGEGAEGSQTIMALQAEVKELRESLQKQEMDVLKNAVVSISNQVSEMRKDMATQSKLEGRYALLDKTIGAIENQLTGIRTDAKPLISAIGGAGGKETAPKSPEERAKIARGLKQAVAMEEEARKLEDELLFSGKPQS